MATTGFFAIHLPSASSNDPSTCTAMLDGSAKTLGDDFKRKRAHQVGDLLGRLRPETAGDSAFADAVEQRKTSVFRRKRSWPGRREVDRNQSRGKCGKEKQEGRNA